MKLLYESPLWQTPFISDCTYSFPVVCAIPLGAFMSGDTEFRFKLCNFQPQFIMPVLNKLLIGFERSDRRNSGY